MLLAASLLALGSIAFALILTPITRDLFKRCGFVDRPTGGRKVHDTPIPRIGGIAIVASIGLSVVLTWALGLWAPFVQNLSIQLLIRLMPAAGLIFLVGVLDDLFTLKAWQKLLG